jgi:glycosyltransferase involved in cell wall biosynthesis
MGVLEAAACELPTVATDVPGLRQAVVHGVTGWLTPPEDAAALSSTMAALMRLPMAMRRTMGRRARQFVVEQYGLDTVLDRWEALYRTCLQPKPGRLQTPVFQKPQPHTGI